MRALFCLSLILLFNLIYIRQAQAADTVPLWGQYIIEKCVSVTECKYLTTIKHNLDLELFENADGVKSALAEFPMDLEDHKAVVSVEVNILKQGQQAVLPIYLEIDPQSAADYIFRDFGELTLRKISDLTEMEFPPIATRDGKLRLRFSFGYGKVKQ